MAQTKEFENERATTKIQIVKTDQNGENPLAGAIFRLYKTPECDDTPVLIFQPTGEDGAASSADFQITQEWYYLKEVKAPEGYTLSRTVIPVKPQNGATVTVEPIRNGKDGDMAEIHIIKKDQNDPDKVLAGAIYGIYLTDSCEPGTEVGSIGPTKEDGSASSGTFVKIQNNYYLKELQAPEDYECSEDVVEVNVEENEGTVEHPVVLYDTKEQSQIKVYKYDTILKEQIKGIQFTAYLDKECKTKLISNLL